MTAKVFFYKLRSSSRCQGHFCSFWANLIAAMLHKRMRRMA